MWKVERGEVGPCLASPQAPPSPALTLVPLLTSTKASLSWVSALPPAHMYVLGVYHAPEYQCWVPELSAVPCLSLPTHHCSAYSNLVP